MRYLRCLDDAENGSRAVVICVPILQEEIDQRGKDQEEGYEDQPEGLSYPAGVGVHSHQWTGDGEQQPEAE